MPLSLRQSLALVAVGTFLAGVGLASYGLMYDPARVALTATGALILGCGMYAVIHDVGPAQQPLPHPPRTDATHHLASPAGPVNADLFAGLAPLHEKDATGPLVPDGLDPATGELVGDRVARLEEQIAALGAVVAEQTELTARAYAALRQEVSSRG